MSNSEAKDADALYRAYRRELLDTRAVSSIRIATTVIVAMNIVFMWLDHHVYFEMFWRFFAARMLLNCVLAVVAFWMCKRNPEISLVALGIATGALLLYVIYGAGPVSEYFTGLILLFCGLPMLLPFSTKQAFGVCIALVLGYAAFPLVGAEVIETEPYAINVAFLVSAAVISVACCRLLNRWRLTDFIQREELERAKDHLSELDRAKSRFTANIHHELRTPLTLILAPLAALRDGEYGEVPAFIEATLKTMDVNGRRLHKLINNLLDLAKLESSQFSIDRQPMILRDLADDVVAGAKPLAERKGIELSVEGFDNLPTLNADVDALDKVLVNLLGNALKFTEKGGKITIWAGSTDAGETRLEIRDTGIGIPPDQLAKVFDRFAQLDGSNTRKHEGTGIGLSLVLELVELHGGRIWAESKGLGRGTIICVVIPYGEADSSAEGGILRSSDGSVLHLRDLIAATEAELNLEADDEQNLPGPQTVEMQRSVERWENLDHEQSLDEEMQHDSRSVPEILIAEDNPDMRKLLAHLLSREFRVRVTRNGREALESLRENPPHLVLTDVMMPEMSGTELCAAIKGDESTRHIPVVLVTSKAEHEMKIEGLEIGADDYVTKPFHRRELLARVRSLVRVRDLQDSLAEQNASLERALSELKKTQEFLVRNERLAAVGELAAGIAHEVNNPVNFALNASRALSTSVKEIVELSQRMAELEWRDRDKLELQMTELVNLQEELGADDIPNTIVELSAIVSDGLSRTSGLVRDLMNFASPSRSLLDPVDLRQGLVSTVHLLKQVLDRKRARVELDIQKNLPEVVGDAGSLNQIFLNLLKNAAEAESDSGVTIRVESRVDDEAISLTFSDDGPGMSLEAQSRLFEPFFSTKPAGSGTGLGLSISRQIAEAHAGTLTAESTPGNGTTFTLRLPLSK